MPEAPPGPPPGFGAARSGVGWPTLGTISAGGVAGALARYGLAVAVPRPPGGFPWATFAANVGGCLLIGVLMVLLTEVWPGRPLVRPFLGIGVLGGFTTFSTYVVDIGRTAAEGSPRTALVYLVLTMAGALGAAYLGAVTARWITRPRREGPWHRRVGRSD